MDCDDALLQVGNKTALWLKAHRFSWGTMPEGSWQVSFAVEKSMLTFSVFLDYELLFHAWMGEATEPIQWISLVALYAAAALKQQSPAMPGTAEVAFLCNGHKEGGWHASCTVSTLEKVAKEVEGQTLSDAIVTVLVALENLNHL